MWPVGFDGDLAGFAFDFLRTGIDYLLAIIAVLARALMFWSIHKAATDGGATGAVGAATFGYADGHIKAVPDHAAPGSAGEVAVAVVEIAVDCAVDVVYAGDGMRPDGV